MTRPAGKLHLQPQRLHDRPPRDRNLNARTCTLQQAHHFPRLSEVRMAQHLRSSSDRDVGLGEVPWFGAAVLADAAFLVLCQCLLDVSLLHL